MARTIRSQIILDAVDQSASGVQSATRNLRRLDDQAARTSQNIQRQFSGVAASARNLGGALAAVTVGAGVADQIRNLSRLTDTAKLLQGQLAALGLSQDQAAAKFDELSALATENRNAVDSTVSTYVRIARALDGTEDAGANATKVVDSLTKAITLSNVSTESARAGIIQFAQGFGSASLAGDELRSVMENLPVLAKTLADGLGVTTAELRKLGSQGKLTRDVLTTILVDANEALSEGLEKIPVTIGQAFQQLNNAALQFAKDSEGLNAANDAVAAGVQQLALDFDTLVEAVTDVGTALAVLAVPQIIGLFQRRAAAIQANTVALTQQAAAERAAAGARVTAASQTLAAAQAELVLTRNRAAGIGATEAAAAREIALGRVRAAQAALLQARLAGTTAQLTLLQGATRGVSAAFSFVGKALLPLLLIETAFGSITNIADTTSAAIDGIGDALGGDVNEAANNFRNTLSGLTDEQGRATFVAKAYESSIQFFAKAFEPGSDLSDSLDAFTMQWSDLSKETKEAADELVDAAVAAGQLPSKLKDAQRVVKELTDAFSETTSLNVDQILETGLTGQTFEGILLDIGLDPEAEAKVLSDIKQLNKLVGDAGEQQVLSVAERAIEATKLIEDSFQARAKLQEELEERSTKIAQAGAKERSDLLKSNLEARRDILGDTIEARQKVLDTILKREKILAKNILTVEKNTADARDAIANARQKLSPSNNQIEGVDPTNLIEQERNAREEVSRIRQLFEEGDNERALKAAQQLSQQITEVADKANEDRTQAAEDSGLSAQGVKFVLERELNDILTDLDSAVQENDGKRKEALVQEQKALQTLGQQATTELGNLQRQASNVLSELNRVAKIDIDLALETGEAEKALNELTRPRTVQITAVTETVEARAEGGPIGTSSGAQTASAAPQAGFQTRQGQLPGFGGGDRVKALLEPGEFIINKDAAKDIGPTKLNELNNTGSDAINRRPINRRTGGMVDEIQRLQTGGFAKLNTSELVGVAISGRSLSIDAKLELDVSSAERSVMRLGGILEGALSGIDDQVKDSFQVIQDDFTLTGPERARAGLGFTRDDAAERVGDVFGDASRSIDKARGAASRLSKALVQQARATSSLSSQTARGGASSEVADEVTALVDTLTDLRSDLSGTLSSIRENAQSRIDDLSATDFDQTQEDTDALNEKTSEIVQAFKQSAEKVRDSLAETIQSIEDSGISSQQSLRDVARQIRGQGRTETFNRDASIEEIKRNNKEIRQFLSEGRADLAEELNQANLDLVQDISDRVKDEFGRTIQDTETSSEEALLLLQQVSSNDRAITDARKDNARQAAQEEINQLKRQRDLEISLAREAARERKKIRDTERSERIQEIKDEANLRIQAEKEEAKLRADAEKMALAERLSGIKQGLSAELFAIQATAEAQQRAARDQQLQTIRQLNERSKLLNAANDRFKNINRLVGGNIAGFTSDGGDFFEAQAQIRDEQSALLELSQGIGGGIGSFNSDAFGSRAGLGVSSVIGVNQEALTEFGSGYGKSTSDFGVSTSSFGKSAATFNTGIDTFGTDSTKFGTNLNLFSGTANTLEDSFGGFGSSVLDIDSIFSSFDASVDALLGFSPTGGGVLNPNRRIAANETVTLSDINTNNPFDSGATGPIVFGASSVGRTPNPIAGDASAQIAELADQLRLSLADNTTGSQITDSLNDFIARVGVDTSRVFATPVRESDLQDTARIVNEFGADSSVTRALNSGQSDFAAEIAATALQIGAPISEGVLTEVRDAITDIAIASNVDKFSESVANTLERVLASTSVGSQLSVGTFGEQQVEQATRKVVVDLTVGGEIASGEFDDDAILTRLLAELEAQGRVSNL